MNQFKKEIDIIVSICIGITIALICSTLPIAPIYQIFIGLISCIIVGLITTEEK